ncbi:S-type pyocin domain-containing protein [Pseudomonas sp. PGPR40]|uniref:S-type pyocin domain-containing protein n=1 Tax=Pseudomonas sp. PGPR40 TaxID=2913476 RepID=UPI001EDC92E6|nr:S-type pyocin domain-containing protein [Pseudomonas sp. PGPR40]
MQKPPTWELTEAVHTTAVAPLHIPITAGTSSVIPHSGMFGPHNFGPHHIVIANSHTIDATKKSIEQEYQTRISQLPHTIEQELAATRLEGSTHPLPPADAIIRELGVRNTLLIRKTADFHQKTALANQFYGGDPLNRSLIEFYQKASAMGQRVLPGGIAMQAWAASYRAAHEARLLAQSIQMLNQQQVNVLNWLAAVQTNDQARIAAEQEAHRAAAELARINEQARLAALAEAARLAAERERVAAEERRQEAIAEAARLQKEQEEIRNREQARLAALAEAQRMAVEQARLAAEAAARQVAAEQARLAALAEQQRQAELRWAEAERQEQEKRQAIAEVHHVYPTLGAAAVSGPVFAFASTTTLAPAGAAAILTALRSALQWVTMAGAAMAGPVLMGFAALLTPSRLGNGERFVMSVPLAELSSESAQSLRAIADRQGTLDLPVGLGHRPIDSGAEVFVITANDFDIRSSVPVLHATYDLLNDVYETVLPDSPTDVLTWTPAITPSDNSTELPIAHTQNPAYSGAPIVPIEGRLDLHPILVEGWDRFIIVFPDDSGIAPLYVVFSSPYQGASVKGKYSGRLFNPEQAGGPILDLDWRTAVITQTGIDAVKLHIARLDQSDANDMMVQRLEKILNGYSQLTDTDLRYYTHEIRELERFRALGLSDDFKPDKDLPIWNNAHTATLEDFKLHDDESLLYTKDAIAAADRQDEVFFKNFLKGGKQ